MFGYININKPELKIKDYDKYHSYYCGLCYTLKKECGQLSRFSLNFDMTFILILLSSLYEVKDIKKNYHCVLHPIHKQTIITNELSSYAAKMTILLTYFKCKDDWEDERKYTKRVYKEVLSSLFDEVEKLYPNKVAVIKKELNNIKDYEDNGFQNLEDIANCFGRIMGEICKYRDDEWADDLYEFGFYLGKFIYFMDAYDDIEEDIKKKRFNPLKEKYKSKDFEKYCHQFLELMIARSTMVFETLPIIENVDILRNILYGGIWTKYVMISKKRGG